MAIVVDANVLVVMVSGDPRRDSAQTHMRRWIAAGESIHAPALSPYEVASGLTRLVAGALFPPERVGEAWQAVLRLPITCHQLQDLDNLYSLRQRHAHHGQTSLRGKVVITDDDIGLAQFYAYVAILFGLRATKGFTDPKKSHKDFIAAVAGEPPDSRRFVP